MNKHKKMESFEMENDFDEGQMIAGEFYNGKCKDKCTQTKDDLLYCENLLRERFRLRLLKEAKKKTFFQQARHFHCRTT